MHGAEPGCFLPTQKQGWGGGGLRRAQEGIQAPAPIRTGGLALSCRVYKMTTAYHPHEGSEPGSRKGSCHVATSLAVLSSEWGLESRTRHWILMGL
jgi:hypothetical protein